MDSFFYATSQLAKQLFILKKGQPEKQYIFKLTDYWLCMVFFHIKNLISCLAPMI